MTFRRRHGSTLRRTLRQSLHEQDGQDQGKSLFMIFTPPRCCWKSRQTTSRTAGFGGPKAKAGASSGGFSSATRRAGPLLPPGRNYACLCRLTTPHNRNHDLTTKWTPARRCKDHEQALRSTVITATPVDVPGRVGRPSGCQAPGAHHGFSHGMSAVFSVPVVCYC